MLKKHTRYAMVALVAAPALAVAAPAFAQVEDLEVEANVSLVSDYRFRGISLSDEDIAIQGGFDVGLPSGFYVGTWGSSIAPYGGAELELDAYGGYGFEANGFSFDVGALWYLYPGGPADAGVDYGEVYGSVGSTFGVIDAAVGVAYSWEQDNLGDDSNTYVYGTGEMPLGDSGFSLAGSLGYTDGALDLGEDGLWDWSIGVSTSVLGVDVGVAYVDTSADDIEGADATAVLSIGKSF